jgi:hypothetical protein
LATTDSHRTRQALRDAMLDSHPLVQEAAEAALAQLTQSDTVAASPAITHDTVSIARAAERTIKGDAQPRRDEPREAPASPPFVEVST